MKQLRVPTFYKKYYSFVNQLKFLQTSELKLHSEEGRLRWLGEEKNWEHRKMNELRVFLALRRIKQKEKVIN